MYSMYCPSQCFLEQCVDSPAIVFVTISVPLSNEINEIATCFCPFGTCPMKDRLGSLQFTGTNGNGHFKGRGSRD